MKRLRFVFLNLHLIAIAGCGILVGNPNEADDSSTVENTSSSDIQMNGEFQLKQTGAALLAQDYSFQCKTFDNDRLTCQIPVTLDGNTGRFDQSCTEFSDRPFGCFLKQNETVMSTIQFNDSTSLQAKGGKLPFNLNYDINLGFSQATLGLGTSVVDNAIVRQAPAMTGAWTFQCEEDASLGLNCQGAQDYTLQFYNVDTTNQSYISMWWEESRRQQCIGDGSEADPSFFTTFRETRNNFSLKTREQFTASVDQIYGQFPSTIRNEIITIANQRISDDITTCQTSPQDNYLPTGGCDLHTGEFYSGLFNIQVDEVRRTVARIYRDHRSVIEGHCQRSIGDTFNFNRCDEGNAPFVCDQLDGLFDEYGLEKASDGSLQADQGFSRSYFYEKSVTDVLCPDAYDAYQAAIEADSDPNPGTYALNCRTEFLTDYTTAVTQARQLSLLTDIWLPGASILACRRPADDQLRIDLLDSIEQSCLPMVDYEPHCRANGECNLALRCSGSADGRCYDSNGVFSGAIDGREGFTRYLGRQDGSFELNNQFQFSWLKWDSDAQRTVNCYYVERHIINGQFINEQSFNSVVTSGHTEFCDNQEINPFAGGQHRRMSVAR